MKRQQEFSDKVFEKKSILKKKEAMEIQDNDISFEDDYEDEYGKS